MRTTALRDKRGAVLFWKAADLSVLTQFLAVGVGGAIGAMARFGVGLAAAARGIGADATLLAINCAGALAIGALAASASTWGGAHGLAWRFAAIGVLGGFTTMSGVSLIMLEQMETRRAGLAALYGLATIIGGVACAFVGASLVRGLAK